MPAPVISSGLVSPPPETDEAALKGAMDDYFSFAPIASSVTREEDEERGADDEKQTQTAQPANAARSGVHAQPLESIDSSGSSANGVVGQARREAIMGDSPDNKWCVWLMLALGAIAHWSGDRSRILLPREQVILSGPVMSRHGLFNKKRYLILTDYPRLLVVREAKTRIKIKHEILIGVEAGPKSPSAGPAGHHHHHHTHGVDAHKGDQKGKHKDHDVQALQVLNAVVEDGQKAFKVITVSVFRMFSRVLWWATDTACCSEPSDAETRRYLWVDIQLGLDSASAPITPERRHPLQCRAATHL